MPSHAERPRLCLIGDSHLASVRLAERQGLLDLSGYDVEYWGAFGPHFRGLVLRNGRMAVHGAKARAEFARINGNGRADIAPGEFDELVFYGCRVRCSDFFGQHLQRRLGDGGWQSRAVMAMSARGFLASSRAYRIGAIFARDHGARIAFVPGPLLTAGVQDYEQPGQFLDLFPDSVRAGPEDRAWLRSELTVAAASDGVRLILQPEETIVDGVFTDAVYAVEAAVENQDPGHKSPAFAALMLSQWDSAVIEGANAARA